MTEERWAGSERRSLSANDPALIAAYANVSLPDIARSLHGLHGIVSNMAGSVDGVVARIGVMERDIVDYEIRIRAIERVADLATVSNDHESRLRMLEKWRYALPGTLILSVGSVLLTLLLNIN